MPEWLACLVEDAVGNALKGKPDEVLGFGNERMMSVWRKWGKRWRDDYVRKIARAWTPGRNGCSTRTALKAMLAREFKTSVKNIEKIILGSRAPTFQTKK
jgi:hypothetical protein